MRIFFNMFFFFKYVAGIRADMTYFFYRPLKSLPISHGFSKSINMSRGTLGQ